MDISGENAILGISQDLKCSCHVKDTGTVYDRDTTLKVKQIRMIGVSDYIIVTKLSMHIIKFPSHVGIHSNLMF